MGKDKKRKHDVGKEDETEQPPTKIQIIDNHDQDPKGHKTEKSNGAHRQMKSERRRKGAQQPKQKASSIRQKEPATESSNIAVAVQDDISSGQDFVPLTKKSSAAKSEKIQSSRAIRKERRQDKPEDPKVEESPNTRAPASGQAARFICFVGNLPYTVTTEQIAAHFSKLQPKSIRLSTDKQTGKCKGFAFLEFENYDKMKTCLKLYHHSIFDPDNEEQAWNENSQPQRNAKSKARKINVELTAGGGGGKSAGRRDKIKVKNQKLDEERARDWEKKKQEERENSRGQRPGRRSLPASGANAEQSTDEATGNRGDIHPSRLNRVRG